MGKNVGVQPRVMEYLDKRQGQTVWLNDINQELFQGTARPASIQQCILRLRDQRNWPIEIVQHGQAWIYKAATPTTKTAAGPAKRIFEELGTTKSGRLVIQDSNGTLYEATEL